MTKDFRRLYEIDILRVVACLSVVLLHSIKFQVGYSTNPSDMDAMSYSFMVLAGLLAFGTPTFIVLSEVLLSKSYPNKLPTNFWSKRIKYLLLPFISMSLFYAIVTYYKQPMVIPKDFLYNLLGNYHGWFIIVIFQFYFLHTVFIRFSHKYKARNVLLITFIINVSYMAYFNFTTPFSDSSFIIYWWDRGFWLPFLGWIFYFSLAYYLGKYYRKIVPNLHKYKKTIYTSVILSILIVITNNNIIPNIEYGSKRFDVIFLTISVISLVLMLVNQVQYTNKFVDLISRYSFGIYLMHWFVIRMVIKIFSVLKIDFGYLNIILYLFAGIAGSIAIVYLLNKTKYGKYIVGNVKESDLSKLKTTRELVKQ